LEFTEKVNWHFILQEIYEGYSFFSSIIPADFVNPNITILFEMVDHID